MVKSASKISIVFYTFFAGWIYAQSVYVPLNFLAYDFIDRLETKGLISGALNNTKPYTRTEMVQYLLQVQNKIKAGAVLNAVEQKQFDFLRFEFSEEFIAATGQDGSAYQSTIQKIKESKVGGKIVPGFLYRNHRNLFSIKSPDFVAHIDPILYQQWRYANPDSMTDTERVFERTHGFAMWGKLGGHIAYSFDFRDTKEWGTKTYPDEPDISLPGLGFVNGYGTHIWHDETNAYLVFKVPYIEIMLGKDFNFWGPGFHGALGLSDNATSFDQIKLQSRFWRLKFTYIWGFLRTYPRIVQADGQTNPKSIVAHRLDIDVAKWLELGLYESVVFGSRRFEFAYINPINFYRSAEHNVNDDDNASLGADFELLLIPNVKIYGELFIDDLNTAKAGNYLGNKKAYLAGAYWVDAFKIRNLDARVEYARTRPYVYGHRAPINTFANFSTGLGHWIGPNADDFYAHLLYRFSRSLYTAASFEIYRHGANAPGRNTGGDLSVPEGSGEQFVDFLDGIREKRTGFGFKINYEVFRNLFVSLNFNQADSENMLLPAGSRGPVARNEFFINIGLNR